MLSRFTLSNRSFDGATQYGEVYFKGQCQIQEPYLFFSEGIFYDPIKSTEELFSTNYKNGVFNVVKYNSQERTIEVKNDRLGMFPLYVYRDAQTFVICSNFWDIINLKGIHLQLTIDRQNFKTYLGGIRIPDEGATYFKYISLLKAGTTQRFELGHVELKWSETRYWDLMQEPDVHLKLNDVVDQMDNNIRDLFKSISNQFPNERFGFGNSGGVDSRIIPMYAKEFDLNLIGCTIGDPKPRSVFYSTTFNSAKQIADLYGFKNFELSYHTADVDARLLLDIKNSPFGGCQVYKNPVEQAPDFNHMLCGGNGFIVSNDNNSWRTFCQLNSEEEQLNFLINYNSVFKNRLRKEKIGRFIGTEDKWQNKTFNSIFSQDYHERFSESLKHFIRANNYKSNFSIIRSFHQRILNKHSPMGGYESLSGTRIPIYLYYPYSLEDSLRWNEDFFYDRKILKSLIIKKDPKLAQIKDQKCSQINGSNQPKRQLAELLIRKSGMDYLDWYHSNTSMMKKFIGIMSRVNPLFEDLLDIKNTQQVKLLELHPNIALDIIKAKRVLDLIYYQETNVFENGHN